MKTAWVFPGQGSQTAGMGLDLQRHPHAQNRFEEAAAILGWSVVECCTPPAEKLSQTRYTQPCLYVVETILADLYTAFMPDYVAGHSLGEFVALYRAGVYDFGTGLRLVKLRAELMDQASGGQMVALLEPDRDQLDQVLAQTSEVVLANDNHPGQVVISGTPVGIATVLDKVSVKRAVPLAVSGAFHSPFMAEAAAQFNAYLATVPFADARIPVLSNTDPTPSTDGALLKQRLLTQMTTGVRWREIVLQLAALGVTRAVELGPGKVLTGLIKRTVPEMELLNVATL
ncbi:MAG: ACP S-malonyltransferase [Gloeomargarita sp. SKYBB_i_bin120]|nr:ACP S-malonyltransferase [Gloeomargarita sp. SKYB120]MDW8179216.1 ACP S-malonyltransferase [Gloeomargarita sp. SKYBB_i_bin120]